MQDQGKYRRHRRSGNRSINKMLFTVILVLTVMLLYWWNVKEYQDEEHQQIISEKDYLPEPRNGVVYHKPYFSLSYVEEYEIPEWVAYRLTTAVASKEKFKRDQDFNPDPEIRTGSAHYHDYKQSGYRRGHLVPSYDMAWDKNAMDATFLMSNVVPMRQEFNDGVWHELEKEIRGWSASKDLVVIAGPVLRDFITVIGDNEVYVPKYFYKAVFTVVDTIPSVVGFLFDQTIDRKRLEDYIVPVDSIEKVTGLDLFANMYGSWEAEIHWEKQRERAEGQWPFYETRIEMNR